MHLAGDRRSSAAGPWDRLPGLPMSTADTPTPPGDAGALPAELEDLLNEAWFDLQGAAREEALDRLYACHPEQAPALRAQIEKLAAAERVVWPLDSAAAGPQAPARIGPYRVLREIGQGGFGIVYLAEQLRPVRREVAVKLMLGGQLQRRALERFEAERRVLSMMEHPHIARVIDAGSFGFDQPYFVMEYVQGTTITRYCDDQRLGLRARLELFRAVCGGVQHAHQKGVLHRDLKPSNILVKLVDGRPVPKIIDFGIAKALDEEMDPSRPRTEQGRVLGTPEYMSPEQAEGLPVDARTDIYALGVLLYELLAGCLPFASAELRQAGMLEMAQVLRRTLPQLPSEALRADPEAAAAISVQRGTTPAQLHAAVRGDLDCIIAKTLEKDPDARYAAASELAEDVRRHLESEVVLARRPAMRYLASRFVRRHRVAVTSAALLVLGLVLAVVGAVWGLLQIDAARQDAVHRQRLAEFNAYAANITAAKAALDNGDIRSLRGRLAAAPVEHRSWEWRHLQASCDVSQASLAAGGEVVDLALVPGGDLVLVADGSGGVRALSSTGAGALFEIPGSGSPRALAVDPRGSRFWTATRDGALEEWDVRSGERLRGIASGEQEHWSVACSADGRWLACAGRDAVVRLIDLHEGGGVRELRGHTETVLSLAFSPDGSSLASGGTDCRVLRWDLSGTAPEPDFALHEDHVRCVRFSMDGALLGSMSRDGAVQIAKVADAEVTARMRLDTYANQFAFHPEAPILVAAGGWRGDSCLRAYDTETGAVLRDYFGHSSGVMSVVAEAGRIVTGSLDGTLRFWSWRPSERARVQVVEGVLVGIVADRNSGRVFGATLQGAVSAWDSRTLARRWSRSTGLAIRAMTMDRARMAVVVATQSGSLHRFSCAGGDPVGGVRQLGQTIDRLVVSGDGRWVVYSTAEGRVAILRGSDLEAVQVLAGHEGFVALGFSADGEALATADASGRLRRFQVGTWAMDWACELAAGPCHGVLFSPDGRSIAGHARRGTRLVDARRGVVLHRLSDHEPGYGMCFTPDSRRFLSAGLDRSVRIIDVQRGVELMVLHEVGPLSLSFDGSGDDLVGASFRHLYRWSGR